MTLEAARHGVGTMGAAVGAAQYPLTAIVLTKDEGVNIGPCLEGLAWADDVVVVDSGSADDTVARARAVRPDVRVFEHKFEDFGRQRNFALQATSPAHDWVLFLDADERCTPACAGAIRAGIETAGDRVGFYLTPRNLFLGHWIRRSTLYPSWQLRLLRRGRVQFRREGHGQREEADGPLGYVREPYDHLVDSKGLEEWIARHNRYSSAEVELIERLRSEPLRLADAIREDPVVRRRCWKRLAARTPCRALARFLYLYAVRAGFLDGRAGWIYCRLRYAHEIHIEAKRIAARMHEGK